MGENIINSGRDAKKDAVTLFDAIQIVKAFYGKITEEAGHGGAEEESARAFASHNLTTTQGTLEELLVVTERHARGDHS